MADVATAPQPGPDLAERCTQCEVSWVACRVAGGACCRSCTLSAGGTHPDSERAAQ